MALNEYKRPSLTTRLPAYHQPQPLFQNPVQANGEIIHLPSTVVRGEMSVESKGMTATNKANSGTHTGRTANYAVTDEGDFYRCINNGATDNFNYFTSGGQLFPVNHKIYVRAKFRVNLNGNDLGALIMGTGSGLSTGAVFIPSLADGEIHEVSVVAEPTLDRPESGVYLVLSSATNNGHYIDIWKNSTVTIDLTATFGAGNEPTLEECDALFSRYIDSTQSTRQNTVKATGSDPVEETEIISPATLRRLPNGVRDSFNSETGEHVQRVSEGQTGVAETTMIDYIDMDEDGVYYASNDSGGTETGDYGDSLGIDDATVIYELAEAIITYYPKQPIPIQPASTIQYQNKVTLQIDEYQDGIEIYDTNLPIQEMAYVHKLDLITGEFIPIALSDVTVAVDKENFTIAGAVNGDYYEYGYYYPTEISTIPQTEYRTPAGLTLPVSLNGGKSLLTPTVLGQRNILGVK